jgi:hypothetical protein
VLSAESVYGNATVTMNNNETNNKCQQTMARQKLWHLANNNGEAIMA